MVELTSPLGDNRKYKVNIFTAVVMKSIIFWDMTPCSPLSFNRLLATCLLAGFSEPISSIMKMEAI
jgi:hypothetical protein